MSIPTIEAGTRKVWRAWLQKNYNKEKKVHLISYKKHTGKPALTHRESMEEAICFGWIDTTLKRLDEDRFQRTFVKRTSKGKWSKNTLSYAEQLIKEKKMTKAGMEMYQHGLKNGVIDHGLPKNPATPKDLLTVMSPEAKKFFTTLAPSYKRSYIYWIERAKLPETRKKRIQIVAQRAEEGKKPWV